jgi:hypothetical protein
MLLCQWSVEHDGRCRRAWVWRCRPLEPDGEGSLAHAVDAYATDGSDVNPSARLDAEYVLPAFSSHVHLGAGIE